MFLLLVEIFLVAFALIALVTQVVIPVLHGSVLFPFFGTNQDHIEDEIGEALQAKEEERMQSVLKSIKKKGKK